MSVVPPKVLFVAGLTPIEAGGTGGVVTAACLLRDSNLGQHLHWLELSTTVASHPPPSTRRRAWVAAGRLRKFTQLIRQVDATIINASDEESRTEGA